MVMHDTFAPAGQILGDRYRLGRRLGTGGVATVHEAVDTKLDRVVAVKLFTPAPDETSLARFTSEARLVAGMSHPGLVTVYDLGDVDGRPYLVMRLLTGGTLRQQMQHGPMSSAEVARLGVRLAETVRYIHQRQVVHRDIKPANVLMDADGDYYLADFGIARALDSSRLTASGEFVGTAAYIAPEQVTGERPGQPADIYALGLVLLECLTGYREYEGNQVEAALARLHRAPHIPEDLPESWRSLLAAMTATAPGDRPDAATCQQLLSEAGPAPTLTMAPLVIEAAPATTSPGSPSSTACSTASSSIASAAAGAQPAFSRPAPVRRAAWLAGGALALTVTALLINPLTEPVQGAPVPNAPAAETSTSQPVTSAPVTSQVAATQAPATQAQVAPVRPAAASPNTHGEEGGKPAKSPKGKGHK